jgi:hypothetical protein
MCFLSPSTSITLAPRRGPLGMTICALPMRSRSAGLRQLVVALDAGLLLGLAGPRPLRIHSSSRARVCCLALSSRASCSSRLAFCSSQAE